ncbi:MAG: VWA domain-containing protein [Cyclobacteriaceae bacterium]|nr:VWA domain-containing protein [Cyclobacteriaceae bacterium]
MQQPSLLFEHHPIYMVVCLIVAGLYTFLLYRKPQQWNKNQLYLLAGFRFCLVFLLSMLLVVPILKQLQNYFEKPIVVIVLDNSTSIASVLDSTKLALISSKTEEMRGNLIRSNYKVEVRDLENINISTEDIVFNKQATNLHKTLKKIENDYENRNLAEVILLTDGIYNSGVSPDYMHYNFKLNTVGVGDTIPKKDLLIKELKYNKISYQGNQFPLVAKIENRGFINESIVISVYNNGSLLDQKKLVPKLNESVETVEFLLEAKSKGLQRYSVVISSKPNEFNVQNNITQAYIEVIEGKERILMIAASPNPDIKAIRSAIETNSNYEFQVFIPGINKEPDGKFDLIIFHQFPDKRNILTSWFEKYKNENIPYWIITSSNSNFKTLNEKISFAQVEILGRETDDITSSFNEGFSLFSISDDLKDLLRNVPPLQVPFSRVNSNVQVFLYQKLGSVTTRNPLLLISEIDNNKSALMLADGVWKWKLYEYAKYERHTAFNELILKMVQYLSTRQDKRKFKFHTVNREITTSESIQFESEIYNDLYEPIYDKSVDITISNENGVVTNYNYITSLGNSRFNVSGLEEGVYKYTATTLLNGRKEKVSGEFLVKQKNIESISLTANFRLLETLALNSGGQFYNFENFNSLTDRITNDKAPEIIHSEESFQPLINSEWVFILLILLVSAEWFIRKYSGHY